MKKEELLKHANPAKLEKEANDMVCLEANQFCA